MTRQDRPIPMPLVWLAAIALAIGAVAIGTVITREAIGFIQQAHERPKWEN